MAAASIHVDVVRAWPRRHENVALALPVGATVAEALAACGFDLEGIDGYAVFGERVDAEALLRDGDRLELLRPLQVDPKQARQQRAGRRKQPD